MTNKVYLIGSIILLAVIAYWFINQKPSSVVASDPPTAVGGRQIVNMTASYSGYNPNKIKIRAGIPVVWQITSSGNAGCAGAIVAPAIFPDTIYLQPNSTVTKEFTVSKLGNYRFSCSMGMYSGSFEVII